MQLAIRVVEELSDARIRAATLSLAGELRASESEMLLYLAVIHARRLYAVDSYSSMFTYCTQELKFSEGTACRRLAAMRVVSNYPAALSFLSDGRLHVTALAMLEKHLTAANHIQVIERARGRTKRELEWLIAELAPQADVADSIRKAPVRQYSKLKEGSVSASGVKDH